jgi:tetratricopeptide (TPR) repeat protein
MRPSRLALLFALIPLLGPAGPSPAWGAPRPGGQDWQAGPTETDDDKLIKACTAVIGAASESGEDRAVAFHYLCLGYNDIGEHDRAIANCDSAIKLKPDYIEAFLFRGHAWFNKTDYDRAIADYSEAIVLGSTAAATLVERAAAYHKKGDETRAIEDLDQAIAKDSGDAMAFFVRGVSYEALKDKPRAIQDYGEAIRLAPNFAASLYHRGVLRREIGDVGGDKDIARARQIDPRIGRVR